MALHRERIIWNGKFLVIELQLSATSSRTDWTDFNKPEWDFCHKTSWNDAIRLNSTGRCLSTFAIGGCKIDLRQMICAHANQVSLCKYTHTHAHIRASCNDFTFIPSERLQSRSSHAIDILRYDI